MRRTSVRHSVRGFTLVELLVLLAILVAVFCLIAPAVYRVRETADRTQSSNNLHQLGVGCNTCAEQRKGYVPPAYGTWPAVGFETNHAFFYHMLPYLESMQLPHPLSSDQAIKTYSAPLDSSNNGTSGQCSYAVNSSLFLPNVGARYPDCFGHRGAANQILVFERYAVTGYTTHTWSSVSTSDSPQVAAVDGATAVSCQIGFANRDIISGPADRTAHAFTPTGFLVCVGDASTRLMNSSANNAFSYRSGREKVTRTTFNWACDPSADVEGPTDGSW
jgi:Tfp pilus assembly protein PilE